MGQRRTPLSGEGVSPLSAFIHRMKMWNRRNNPTHRHHHQHHHHLLTRQCAISSGMALVTLIVIVNRLDAYFSLNTTIATTGSSTGKVRFDLPGEVPDEIIKCLDAILVLGGGVPESIDEPPPFTKQRCSFTTIPFGGWSTGLGINLFRCIPNESVFRFNRSGTNLCRNDVLRYDSNAFFARTSFTDITGWRNLLIVTNEFHMDRSQAIFEWIFGLDPPKSRYQLYYLAPPNTGLTETAVHARKAREANSQKTVETILSKKYKTMKGVWTFLNQEHSLYTAQKLVERGRAPADGINEENNLALKESYGLKKLLKN